MKRFARTVAVLAAVAAAAPACSGRADPRTPTAGAPPAVVTTIPARDTVPIVRGPIGARLRDATPLASYSGEATYYADRFHGRRTASGVVFSNDEYFAAHRTLPFGTVVRVTNTANGRHVHVLVVDRGPHGESDRQRRTIIDLSRRAASELDFIRQGRAPVRVDVLQWGS
ncbi:MAG TPA: septal ring lytic transglycosylase RlpA family protein [Longimicrobiales bacterium]|nr:septal ring lytic transglycosylase RlpA family protein [Longimicrobiales bacterium]